MAIPEFDELWGKARLFAKRSLDPDAQRDFGERVFWATTALEFLAKAALAHVSPLLIVPPDADGKHVLATLGVIAHDGANIQTIQAKALWARAERVFRPFSGKEATHFSAIRNDYMHGSGTGVPPHPEEVWWGKYWHQAAILTVAADQDLQSLVGFAHASRVEQYLAQHKSHVEEHVEALLERARQRVEQRGNPSTPASLRDELSRPFDASGGLSHSTTATCPACGEEGVLEGEDTGDTEIVWPDPDEFMASPIEVVTVLADYFGCGNCHLVFDRLEFLDQAGIETTFTKDREYEPDDYDYGND
ncbi:hypothetical protein [Microbacterium maritypicum]|uniref:hypothetical protein n=1 Tax=Microbacterium maritypicum TaxID=33918 RepID=UPI0037FEED7E